MKYREVVQFDPVVDIKVLVEADDFEKAREDVRTFVVSDRMLSQLRDIISPTSSSIDLKTIRVSLHHRAPIVIDGGETAGGLASR